MVIGAPTMAVATLRLPRRSTLVGALAVFIAGQILGAVSTTYAVLLAARIVTAVATGAFWVVAAGMFHSALGRTPQSSRYA